MMKKIIVLISFLFCTIYCFAQFPIKQGIGGPTTQVTTTGALASDSGYVYRYNFPDTTTANRGFLKNIPGIIIRVNDTLQQRNNTATAWNKLGGGEVITAANGLTKSGTTVSLGGTLTGATTIDGSLYSLKLFRNSSTTNPGGQLLWNQVTDTITNGAGLILGLGIFGNKRSLFPNTLRSDYMGGYLLSSSYEAKDSVYIYSVGGDFGWNVSNNTTLTKYPSFSGRTVIQGGTVITDAVPNHFSQITVNGPSSSGNNIRARGYWANNVSFINMTTAFDTLDYFIDNLGGGFNSGRILKRYFNYGLTDPRTDSIWGAFYPYSTIRSVFGGPVSFGDSANTGPTQSVEVKGHIKMVDGNQHNGYVLTSDANGVASWSAAGATGVTSIATNNGTGITGGTITSTGTLAIDTTTTIQPRLTFSQSVQKTNNTVTLVGDANTDSTAYVNLGGKQWRKMLVLDTTGFAAGATYLKLSGGSLISLATVTTTPPGNNTDLIINRNSSYAAPGNDSLNWIGGSLNTKGNITIAGLQMMFQADQTNFGKTFYIGNMSTGGSALSHSSGIQGGYNVYVGQTAGNANTTGSANTGIGSEVMKALTTAVNNTGVGTDAFFSHITGDNNTAIGKGAMQNGTGSSSAVAIGRESLISNAAAFNTGVGDQALFTNSSGLRNVGVGPQTGYFNATGSHNTHIGAFAGTGVTGNNNSDNTSLGYLALTGITTGGRNIAIGDSAAYTLTTSSHSITIGSALTDNGNNSLNIGGMIFGTGMTATGTSVAGSMGVNVPSPSAALHILKTTEQLRVAFDASNYYSTTVSSAGSVTYDAVGSSAGFTFNDGIGSGTTGTVAFPLVIGGSGWTSGGIGMVGLSISPAAGSSPALEFIAGTIVESGSGTHTYEAGLNVDPPTITAGAATATDAATVRISGATTATVTGTNSSLLVAAGVTRLYGGVQVGSTGSTLLAEYSNSATLDFGSTAAGATTDLTITVTGAADGDVVMLGVPNGSEPAGTNLYNWRAWVSSANTVTIRLLNMNTVTAIDPASGTFRAAVLHY